MRAPVLHDEARRDDPLEVGFGLVLALHLLEEAPRRLVPGLALQHGAEMAERRLGAVALVVEVGQEQPRLGVELRRHRALERCERLARPPRVHGREAERLEERGRVWCLAEPLTEEQQRLVGPTLAQRLPAPALEAPADVLAARGAPGVFVGRAGEALARARELARRVEALGLLQERAAGAARRDRHDGRDRLRRLVAPPRRPAEPERQDAQRPEDSEGAEARAA